MNRRKWFSFLIAAFACVGMSVFTACGDDDDPATPEGPKFDKAKYEFVGKIDKTFAEFADVTMTVETPTGKQEHVLTGSTEGYKIAATVSASLPYTVKISFTCTPKAGFTPQEGVAYDARLTLDYDVAALDTNGKVMDEASNHLKVTKFEGLDLFNNADSCWADLAKKFPFQMTFTIEKYGDGVWLSKSLHDE